MTTLHAHLLEIDRVWNDQVQYADQQRNQRIQQCVASFLQTNRQSLQDAYRKISDIEQEKGYLQQKITALEKRPPEKQTDETTNTVNIYELLIDIHQLGLRLAQAWNIRPGTREEIEQQFKARGLENNTMQRMCATAGFWEDLEHHLAPRRSDRLQAATD